MFYKFYHNLRFSQTKHISAFNQFTTDILVKKIANFLILEIFLLKQIYLPGII
jgi:hypothetical protein